MQDKAALCRVLLFQCFPQGANCQVAGDVPVRYAGHHTPVVQVYDGTVIAHISILQEQVCKIRTPFLVWSVCPEILLQTVLEHFVWFPRFCPWLFRTDNGAQAKFRVHIFMDGRGAVVVSLSFQVYRYASIAVHAIMIVVNVQNLLLYLLLLSIIIRLSVLPVVIVGIRTNPKPPQQPTDAEFLTMLLNKSVSLYPISFAKNAAAFFKNAFSFRNSSFSRFKRRFSFIES